ncbi:multicopper oxidase LPR2-like [Magnolia sinica]|uniref:multicopper oxidase LPR2-like n=1 Tax=Magnolia sinica TaxID=86752 RepID=UPI002659BA13|nr:multicopper oxidase LPR2-like [Magnolia sinica]
MATLKLLFFLSLLWALRPTRAQERLINVSKLEMFVDNLPDMPKIQGFTIRNGIPVSRSIKIGMFEKKWKFHRDLPPTRVFAYGTSDETATVPGPTIEALQGIETRVRWENHLPSKHILPWDPTIPTAIVSNGVPTVVHLHGGIHEPESDGHANAWFTSGFQLTGPTWSQKTYRYHNVQQPGNLWYHDHAVGLTRVNLLAGLIGSYVIHQPDIEGPLGLPSGPEFDRHLVIFDRSFRTDGSIYMNSTGNNPSIHPQWQPEYFGDAVIVNGKAWPWMKVSRRKYRFRILNACNARFFRLFFSNGLRFINVASDSAYLARPVTVSKLLVGPSEIADVIVDFSMSTSDVAILANDAPYPFPTGTPADEINGKVMKFIIDPHQTADTSRVPSKLIEYPVPKADQSFKTRYIAMYEYTTGTGEPTHLYINGKAFDEPVTETPKVGSTEVWYVINLTGDNHPLHIHLGLFVTLEQTELVGFNELRDCMMKMNDPIKCHVSNHARGKRIPVADHERGWKNVYNMNPMCITKILVRFALLQPNTPYPFNASAEPGYVYHCHILDHEDNTMIRPLKIIS